MAQARTGISKTLYCFDPSVVDSALLTGVVKLAGVTVAALTFTMVNAIPNLYRSSAFTLLKTGQHEVLISYNGVVIESYFLVSDLNPATDFPAAQAVKLKFLPGALGTGETVTARIVNSAGVASGAISAPYDAQKAAYEASYTFAAIGDFSVVWYRLINAVTIPFFMEQVFVTTPSGREVIRFLAATLSGNGGTPHVGTTIVVVDENDVVVGKVVTDSVGKAVLSLEPGSYTAALVKSGLVFSVNNIAFTVDLGVTSRPASTIHLISSALAVSSLTCTFSGDSAPTATCKLSASLYRMDGTPLRYAVVQIGLMHRPQLFSGVSVFDTDLSALTDTNGYVEIELVRGIQIEVSIAPLSLRRIITVPDAPEANLLTLMSQAQDLFDIVAPQLPAAAKRSL